MPGSIPGLMSQINKHACKTVCDVNPGIDPGPSKREKIGKFYLSVFQSFLSRKKNLGVTCTLIVIYIYTLHIL